MVFQNCINFEICNLYVEIGPYDAFTYITVGLLCMTISSIIILSYFLIKEFRYREGHLILMVSFCDLSLGIHWFMNGIYSRYTSGYSFDCSSNFCFINSIISTIGGTGTLLYNWSFVTFLYICLRSKLTSAKIKLIWFHLFPIFGTLITMGFAHHEGLFGQTVWGTCSVSEGSEFKYLTIFFNSFVIGLYLILIIFVQWGVRVEIPKEIQAFQQIRYKFMTFYSRYLRYSFYIWFTIAVWYSVSAYYLKDIFLTCTPTSWEAKLYGISKIVNTVKMLSPLSLTLLRFSDSILRAKIANQIKCLRFLKSSGEYKSEYMLQKESEKFITITQQMQYTLQVEYTKEILNHMNKSNENHRISLINGFNSDGAKVMPKFTEKDFEEILRETDFNLCSIKKKFEYENSQIEEFEISQYAPNVFSAIRASDSLSFHFHDSLEVNRNLPNIMKAAKSDGGKSGEFFFFTYDHKLMIKSMSDSELDKILKILPEYTEHVIGNQTMIAKIYGLYTIKRTKKQNSRFKKEFNLLLMRNAVAMPSKYKLETYDLKGSTVGRRVWKNNLNLTKDMLKSRVMKDMDFLKFEKIIKIDCEISDKIVRVLESDSKFLSHKILMDYSLLVAKVDKKKYMEDEPINQDLFLNNNNYYSIPSVEIEGVFYHIAIIDYLQTYNFDKQLERFVKLTFKRWEGSDISSLEPIAYSNRFIAFINKIFQTEKTPPNISPNKTLTIEF